MTNSNGNYDPFKVSNFKTKSIGDEIISNVENDAIGEPIFSRNHIEPVTSKTFEKQHTPNLTIDPVDERVVLKMKD